MWLKKTVGALLAVCMTIASCALPQSFAYETAAAETSEVSALSAVQQAIRDTVKQPVTSTSGGEWAVFGMARSGAQMPVEWYDGYVTQLYELLQENNGFLPGERYSEYSRVSLALSAIGHDPSDFEGYDLLASVSDLETIQTQGLSTVIYALLARTVNGIAAEDAQPYLDYILSVVLEDGGFANSGTKGDPDVTSIAICALAPYYADARVKAVIDAAVAFLAQAMQPDGGFVSYGVQTAESAAQVVLALCTIGIDPASDKRFCSETGATPISNLLSFAAANGGYYHVMGTASVSQMATEQALLALTAYERLNKAQNVLYDMTDVTKKHGTVSKAADNGVSADVKKAEKVREPLVFSDMTDHWAKTPADVLSACGIVSGTSADMFSPGGTLTRKEFAQLLVGALGVPERTGGGFDDVDGTQWYAKAALTASYYGLFSGRDGGLFAPHDAVTREEAAVVLAKAAGLCGKGQEYSADDAEFVLGQFDDGRKVAAWSAPSLAFCVEAGLFSSAAMEIRPNDGLTRAEAAQLVYRLMQLCELLPVEFLKE